MAGAMVQVPFGRTMVSRIEPALPAHTFKTYGMAMPLSSHWRRATCAEADCDKYLNGWKTIVPAVSDHADLIRSADFRRRYRYAEQPQADGLAEFVFPAGQACFRAQDHRVPLARPPRFYVKGGDWRGNPRGVPTRVHHNAADWVDDFANHQDRLATAIGRG